MNNPLTLLRFWRELRWAGQMPAGHASLLSRDLLGLGGRNRSGRDVLECAIDWLCMAQDHSDTGGVCASYHLFNGWSNPYPETTGYIAETFFYASEWLKRPDLGERAERMLDWLVEMQLPDGGFPAGIPKPCTTPEPAVFNTGQIMIGLLSGYRRTGSEQWRTAAIRAAHWLCEIQESDGSWHQAAYNGIPHAYYSRVAWPLAALGAIEDEPTFIEAARRHVEWVLGLQQADGWIDNMHMTPGEPVQLHPIAYTLQGLWESGLILDEPRCRAAVELASQRLMRHLYDRSLSGAYEPGWRPCGSYTCLTGLAQMACLWLRMNADNPNPELQDAAARAISILIGLQDLDNPSPVLRGGLRGSYPITGNYMPWSIINWGTKFLIDALLFQQVDSETVHQEFAWPLQAKHAVLNACP